MAAPRTTGVMNAKPGSVIFASASIQMPLPTPYPTLVMYKKVISLAPRR
jgi:hypothetical protein